MTGPSEHSPRPPRLDDETYARLLAWLQQRGADEDVARDILHEALVRFARYRPGLVYSGAELSYLRRVMGSCLLDHLTGQRREREAVGELARATWAEAAAGGAHEDVRLSMATWVRARVDELPPELRDAVVSVDLGGESQRDYAEAGADGLFVPGLTAEADIARVVEAVHLPLNVLALPGLPPPARLEALGVSRLSTGNFAHGVLERQMGAFAKTLYDAPDYAALFAAA